MSCLHPRCRVSRHFSGWLAVVTLAAAAAAIATPASAIPRTLGSFTLGFPHDSLLAVAARNGYVLERDLGRMVSFAPPQEGDAEVFASLSHGVVIRYQFVWPGTPKQEDF